MRARQRLAGTPPVGRRACPPIAQCVPRSLRSDVVPAKTKCLSSLHIQQNLSAGEVRHV